MWCHWPVRNVSAAIQLGEVLPGRAALVHFVRLDPSLIDNLSVLVGDRRSERLHFDSPTQTITLDGFPHHIDDPKAFAVYKAIADACPLPITKRKIQGQVPGCRGVKTIPLLLARLPRPLKDTVRSGVNGYWLDLAPKQKRGKQGHA
jgi:hypothetical protein